MPYCPECRSEYRAGFERCATCDDVSLVDELPEIVKLTKEDDTRAVGITPEDDVSRKVEVEGRIIDLARAFSFNETNEFQRILQSAGFASIAREIEGVAFPGGQVRYEVHVRVVNHEEAEIFLREQWEQAVSQEGGAVDAISADKCPACGSDVPADVEECPDCGLFVGSLSEDDDEGSEDGDPDDAEGDEDEDEGSEEGTPNE